MGRVKEVYQRILERKLAQLENVPIDYTMSGEELEEFQFGSKLNQINFDAQIAADLDKSETESS
jgi:hypothetical protein